MSSSFDKVIELITAARLTKDFQGAYKAILQDDPSIERMADVSDLAELSPSQTMLFETMGGAAKASHILTHLPALPKEVCDIGTSVFTLMKDLRTDTLWDLEALQKSMNPLHVLVDAIESDLSYANGKGTRVSFTIHLDKEHAVALLSVPRKEADLLVMTRHGGKGVHITAKNYEELDAKYPSKSNQAFLTVWIGTRGLVNIVPGTMYVVAEKDTAAHFLSLPKLTEEAAGDFLTAYGAENKEGQVPILLPTPFFRSKVADTDAREQEFPRSASV